MKLFNFILSFFILFLIFNENSLTQWQPNGNNIYFNTGNVGIGTTNPQSKLSVTGNFHIEDITDQNLRLGLGYYKSPFVNLEYGYISTLDWSTNPPTARNLAINSRANNDAWGNVGIGPLEPIQALDIGGRLNLRKGVIQNGTSPITTTEDLGLYSTRSGFNIRIVSNQAPIQFYTDGNLNVIGSTPTLVVHHNGSVGIGTSSPDASFKLSVNGKIRAKEIKVESNWSDFVFKPDYNLMTLTELESYINTNGHLPDIPAESEVTANGVEIGDMTSKLLQKIEELTLYVIEQKKEIDFLKNSINK